MNERIVLTLDAGGTNLVFNAVNSNYEVIASKVIPAPSKDIDEFLSKLISGFDFINKEVGQKATAISFCFPGPADYSKGIIGDLENLPFFRGGIPLKDILEAKFKIPVLINNDGDLFALGEAIGGLLPITNKKLADAGNSKVYRNLLGITLGTGTGAGIVIDGKLLIGDNSAGAEINRSNNYLDPAQSIEETLSIRGIKNLYVKEAGISYEKAPDPGEIYKIGIGAIDGNREAAIRAWELFGTVLGHAIGNAVTLIDGLVVIGGGLSGAHALFMPAVIESLNGQFTRIDGNKFPRLEVSAYNLENPDCLRDFIKNDDIEIAVPGTDQKVSYSPIKKIGIGITKLGTSEAVAVGAFDFAV